MHRTETRPAVKPAFALLLGALLALGVALIILLLGSVAVSAGILKMDTEMQVTAAACLIGCLVGGAYACAHWSTKRLPAGLLTGLICFALIFLVALLSGGGFEVGAQGLIELAGCLVGGALSGVLSGRRKRKKRRSR